MNAHLIGKQSMRHLGLEARQPVPLRQSKSIQVGPWDYPTR